MLRTMEQKYSRRIGSAVMEELGLKASQIDELCKMPYDKVLAAGDKAIAKVRAEAEKEDGCPPSFLAGRLRWTAMYCPYSLSTLKLQHKARAFR